MLVLEPSLAVLEDMIEKIPLLPSDDGADQGFQNSYFGPRWISSRQVFIPSGTDKELYGRLNESADCGMHAYQHFENVTNVMPKFFQLPARYNYLIHWFNQERYGFYFSYNRLALDETPAVIHFVSWQKPWWHPHYFLVKPYFWYWEFYRASLGIEGAYGDLSIPLQDELFSISGIIVLLLFVRIKISLFGSAKPSFSHQRCRFAKAIIALGACYYGYIGISSRAALITYLVCHFSCLCIEKRKMTFIS